MADARKELFTKLRKEKYTILVPDMCPIHFNIIAEGMRRRGYNMVIVTPHGREAKDDGLTAIQNDACYPVVIIAGAFIHELRSGNYDLDHTAVIISQTGGGCRASNYLALFRKAFAKEFPQVPVLSFNFSGLEKETSLPISLGSGLELYHSVLYGDFLTNLVNQARAYYAKEEVDAALEECLVYIKAKLGKASFYRRQKNYKFFLSRFAKLQPTGKRKPRVGVVGEIYVKYSPYANNELCEFLLRSDVEPVFPSLNEFVLYCLYNWLIDHDYYGRNKKSYPLLKLAYRYLLHITRSMNKALTGTAFLPYDDFEEVISCGKKVIDIGVKMGEGWLIPAEMVCFASNGVPNIVVVQPFGCLPNHIVGKGMVRPVKALCPNANIVPLDFDASSTSVNQENRLKLMLANLSR